MKVLWSWPIFFYTMPYMRLATYQKITWFGPLELPRQPNGCQSGLNTTRDRQDSLLCWRSSGEHTMEPIFWDISFPTKTHHLESEAKNFDCCFNFTATANVHVQFTYIMMSSNVHMTPACSQARASHGCVPVTMTYCTPRKIFLFARKFP